MFTCYWWRKFFVISQYHKFCNITARKYGSNILCKFSRIVFKLCNNYQRRSRMRKEKNAIYGNVTRLSFNLSIEKRILNCFDGQDGQNDSSSFDTFGAKKKQLPMKRSRYSSAVTERHVRCELIGTRSDSFQHSLRIWFIGIKNCGAVYREGVGWPFLLDYVSESFVCGFKCIH